MDLHVFIGAQKVVTDLREHDCSAALAWCEENRSRLKKGKNKFEFRLRMQASNPYLPACGCNDFTLHADRCTRCCHICHELIRALCAGVCRTCTAREDDVGHQICTGPSCTVGNGVPTRVTSETLAAPVLQVHRQLSCMSLTSCNATAMHKDSSVDHAAHAACNGGSRLQG